MTYIGRFAPSPTGPLHMGSLVAALISYLDAKANGGVWLLRIEDLDPPREDPNAPDQIIDVLSRLQLTWDGDVLFQSDRLEAYAEALAQLQQQGDVFPCTCTRKAVGQQYKGTCRNKRFEDVPQDYAIRVRVPEKPVEFVDLHQGKQHWDLNDSPGDFIIKRKDGLFAYQLAVVVDDYFQQITHVVRGIDLLDSTPRQIHLQQQLGYPTPAYLHFPVLTDSNGEKLSKQTFAAPVVVENPEETMLQLLTIIKHAPPETDSLINMLDWAVDHWQPDALPAGVAIKYAD